MKLTSVLYFVVLAAHLQQEHRPSSVLASRGCSVDLNCQLKPPYASTDVYLMQERRRGKLQAARIADGEKVSKSGQIFTINKIGSSDQGSYFCKVNETKIAIEFLIPLKTRGNIHVYDKITFL